MRQLLAVAAGAATAAIGALILGEYSMSGFTPVIAGLLFGLAVAEVVLAVGRHPSTPLAAAAAVLTDAGLVWAAWIQLHNRHQGVPFGVWLALVIGALAAAGWIRSSGRRGTRTRSEP